MCRQLVAQQVSSVNGSIEIHGEYRFSNKNSATCVATCCQCESTNKLHITINGRIYFGKHCMQVFDSISHSPQYITQLRYSLSNMITTASAHVRLGASVFLCTRGRPSAALSKLSMSHGQRSTKTTRSRLPELRGTFRLSHISRRIAHRYARNWRAVVFKKYNIM